MKTKLFKRIVSLMMACMMLFALSATAFAAEPNPETDQNTTIQPQIVAPGLVECGPPAKGTCVRGEFPALLITYLATTGMNRILVIEANCESNTGFLEVRLYDPNGNIISGSMWVSGVNERTEWYFTAPLEGDYTVQLVPIGCVAPVYCEAQWFRP